MKEKLFLVYIFVCVVMIVIPLTLLGLVEPQNMKSVCFYLVVAGLFGLLFSLFLVDFIEP